MYGFNPSRATFGAGANAGRRSVVPFRTGASLPDFLCAFAGLLLIALASAGAAAAATSTTAIYNHTNATGTVTADRSVIVTNSSGATVKLVWSGQTYFVNTGATKTFGSAASYNFSGLSVGNAQVTGSATLSTVTFTFEIVGANPANTGTIVVGGFTYNIKVNYANPPYIVSKIFAAATVTIGPGGALSGTDPDAPQPDWDGDGIPDSNDWDDDNDGIADSNDPFPKSPHQTDPPLAPDTPINPNHDNDGDGWPDNHDSSPDNPSVPGGPYVPDPDPDPDPPPGGDGGDTINNITNNTTNNNTANYNTTNNNSTSITNNTTNEAPEIPNNAAAADALEWTDDLGDLGTGKPGDTVVDDMQAAGVGMGSKLQNVRLWSTLSVPKISSYTWSMNFGSHFGTITKTINFSLFPWTAIRLAVLIMMTAGFLVAFLKRVTI